MPGSTGSPPSSGCPAAPSTGTPTAPGQRSRRPRSDAIATRFRKGRSAGTFVRHYEDVAKILAAADELPPLHAGLPALIADLIAQDKKPMPPPDDPSLSPDDGEAWVQVRRAWDDIAPMFWGERITLEDACSAIRRFLAE